MNKINGYSTERIGEPHTLLVVDDDPTVRYLEVEILSGRGYRVLEAENAMAALRLADTNEKIHLLLTDLSMPEMDGIELTRQFRAVHPETPVLLVSGSLALMQDRFQDLPHFDVLEKPFGFEELIGKVEALLVQAAPLPHRNGDI
jgi:CheY-like chemotaxis protein